MNAFDAGRSVEREGWLRLRPYLNEITDGHFVLVNKGAHARRLQEELGDLLANLAPRHDPTAGPLAEEGRLIAIELKVERRFTGNLFLETWSNRNLGDATSHAERGSNPGWLFKTRSDLLFYYFLDADTLCISNVLALKRWAFRVAKKNDPWPVLNYPERAQGQYQQKNDTHGVCVPIADLQRELGAKSFKVTSARQLGMFDSWEGAA